MKKAFAMMLAFVMSMCAGSAMAACAYKTLSSTDVISGVLQPGKYRLPDGGWNKDFSIEGEVVLCLHGKTMSGKIKVEENAHLTIEDCSEDGSGKVTCSKSNSVTVLNEGELTMTGGIIEATGYSQSGVQNKGTFLMSGSASILALNEGGKGVFNEIGDSSFKMTGGMVTAKADGVRNKGTFILSGGEVRATYSTGVRNYSVFKMSDGKVSTVGNHSVINNNDGTFTMTGGTVQAMENEKGCGVQNKSGGTFTMSGGTIEGRKTGVTSASFGGFAVSVGTIKGGTHAVAEGEDSDNAAPLPENSAMQKYIMPGSRKASGMFGGQVVVVEIGLPEADEPPEAGDLPQTDDLPQTGDPSMLGAWTLLLVASAAGLKLRRKK